MVFDGNLDFVSDAMRCLVMRYYNYSKAWQNGQSSRNFLKKDDRGKRKTCDLGRSTRVAYMSGHRLRRHSFVRENICSWKFLCLVPAFLRKSRYNITSLLS